MGEFLGLDDELFAEEPELRPGEGSGLPHEVLGNQAMNLNDIGKLGELAVTDRTHEDTNSGQ
jgi:hypothetical protein